MAFIEESDYLPYIKDQNLQRLTQTDESILIAAEEVAIAIVRDALSGLYDADAIFATTGDARPKQVVLWVLRIVLYQLYERLPAGLTPERVRDNYMEVMAWLRDIEDGKNQRPCRAAAKRTTRATPLLSQNFALARHCHSVLMSYEYFSKNTVVFPNACSRDG